MCANTGQPDTGEGCAGRTCPLNTGKPCFTQNQCSLGNICQLDKTCGGGFIKACPASTACVSYSCFPSTGICVPSFTNSFCSDNNLCTDDDICSGGICRGTAKNCDDGKDNTFDFCSDAGGVAACQSVDTTGGLIPCGRLIDNPDTDDIDESAPCTLCALFYMLKNIINFVMELAIATGVFILILAGLLYSYSAGDNQKINLAKSALTSTLIGLAVVSTAWLIIAVVLQGMGYASITSWNQVSCGL
ncbi:pilin [Patescibacteria group bacterium]|nr:pilin [Patescibacteria group bacterium]